MCEAELFRQSIGEEFLITLTTQSVPTGVQKFPISAAEWLVVLGEEIKRIGVAEELAHEFEIVEAGGTPPCLGCEQAANGLCDPQCKHFSNVSGV